MSDPTRWHVDQRIVAGGAVDQELYASLQPSDVLNIRQLRVSASAAAEVTLYWGSSAADNVDQRRVFGWFAPANGGAAPDLACLGAWAYRAGDSLRIAISAAAVVHVAAEGVVE